jgi:hypothetical protein
VAWTSAEGVAQTNDQGLNAQDAGIRKLIESAKQAGFRDIPQLEIRALPAEAARQFPIK